MRYPSGDRFIELVRRGLRRLQIPLLERLYPARFVEAVFTFVNGTLSIGLLATVAHFANSSFIFPSLGPTAYLLFYKPLAHASSPRNTFYGHLIGALCGWISLMAFGLLDAPATLETGVTWPRVGAAAFSLGATGGLMILLRASHPPAGATTLIVSLGLMPHLWQLPVLLTAVLLLTFQALAINRVLGVPYPLWQSPKEKENL